MKNNNIIMWLSMATFLLLTQTTHSYNLSRSKYFSIGPPDGWIIESNENFDGFTFLSTEQLDESLYISIISNKEESKDLDTLWGLRKKHFFALDKERVIAEKDLLISGVMWKTLLGEWMNVDQPMRKLVLFTNKEGISYMIQFNSPKHKYEEYLPVLNKTLSTLRLERTWHK